MLLSHRDPSILAHRGWSAHYPENTVVAFVEALAAGADGLEFDVRLTADGAVVVMHDASIDRTTDGAGLISRLTYRELMRYNAAANWPNAEFQTIPTLRDVLDAAYRVAPRGLYNIEVKAQQLRRWQPLVNRVLAVVHGHPLKSRVLYSSFHHRAMAYLKRRQPDARVGLLFDRDGPEVLRRARWANADSIHMDYRFVNGDFVQRCHAAGLQVAAWTVDSPADLARIDEAGADIVMTNCVDTAVQTLKRR